MLIVLVKLCLKLAYLALHLVQYVLLRRTHRLFRSLDQRDREFVRPTESYHTLAQKLQRVEEWAKFVA